MNKPEASTAESLSTAHLLDNAAAVRAAVETVAGPWPMAVLTALREEPRRYSELKRHVTGINDRMLTQTLQRFSDEGLVCQEPLSPTSVRCAYHLTELGSRVADAVADFVTVLIELAPQVAKARANSTR